MTTPLILDESIEVDRPLDEVFSYVSAFANIAEWDPAVADAEKLTDGASRQGSQFRIDMKAGFSLKYEITDFEPPHRMVMSVDSRFFTAHEEIRFEALANGNTSVRYIARFSFPAPVAGAARVFPQVMDRVGKRAMEGLQSALEDNFDTPRASSKVALADRLVLPGLWRFTRLGYRAGRQQWHPISASMQGKHVLITGATSGIGLAGARSLAAMGAQLSLVARDARKGAEVVKLLQQETGNSQIHLEVCDMAEMSQVNVLVQKLLKRGKPIDVLINNAGALFNPRQETAEGLEKSFALLLLGPYILTEGLHPLLASAEGARVINVSSGGMYSQKIHVNDLQSEGDDYSGSVAYARAKRGLMILTEEWAQRWADDGIAVNAMHPGWADTPGVQDALPGFYRLTRGVLRTPQEGADTIVWLAAATEAGNVSGEFWLDRQPHPSHIFRRTRESAQERAALLAALEGYAAGVAAPASRRPRRAAAGR